MWCDFWNKNKNGLVFPMNIEFFVNITLTKYTVPKDWIHLQLFPQTIYKKASTRRHRRKKVGFPEFQTQHCCSWTIRSAATKRLSGNQNEWDSCEQARRDSWDSVRIFHFYPVSRFGIFVQRFRRSERCFPFRLALLHIIKRHTIVLLHKCRKSPYIKPLESETSFLISLTQFDSL